MVESVLAFCDVKDEKKAKESPRLLTVHLNALIKHSPLGIVVHDANRKVQMCNPGFERLFGYTQAELSAGSLDELITTPQALPHAVGLTKRVINEETVDALGTRRHKDGSFVEVEIHGVPLMLNSCLVGVYCLYQDITERRRAERTVRELSRRLSRSQEEERRRIARNLHDTTVQNLAAVAINLGRLRVACDETSRSRLFEETAELVEQCVRELRTYSYLLHPPELEEGGLVTALTCYVDGFAQRSGIQVNVEIQPDLGRLSREIEVTVFRITQESLGNVHRHSGSATAHIRLFKDSFHLVLEVADQGRGILRTECEYPSGVGILGMRERIRQLGGTLDVLPQCVGTLVRAWLPLGYGP